MKAVKRIKELLADIFEDAAIPIVCGVVGSFIGMGIAKLIGIM